MGLMIVGLAGCTINRQVPKTTITGTVAGKPFAISTPKDSDLTGLHIKADTNGTVSVDIEHLSAFMNPTNISATGDAAEKIVTATGTQVVNGFNAGASAAGKFVGAAAKTP